LLDQKVTKNQVSKNASMPHRAFAPQTGQNQGLESFARLRSLMPSFYKISYALATLKATIVLPVFARSCFADRREERRNLVGGRVLRMGDVVAWLFTHPTTLHWSTLFAKQRG
jgi:hypothetical protein